MGSKITLVNGETINVTESINKVRSNLNRAADPENGKPFHSTSFTAEDGERIVVSPSQFAFAKGKPESRESSANGAGEPEPVAAGVEDDD
jgi:hypothetical protein